ncbi:MAG: hypothetical protein HBSAPP03_12810 [Phycisphaerae bacterium]|nr:MAG: hypothetical protein HBSAPP03_12810 [Phycisphaerae bacterium]
MRRAVTSWSARGAAFVAALAAVVLVGWPGAVVAWDVVRAGLGGAIKPGSAAVSFGLLANTLGWAGGIALGATLAGIPAAVWIARRGWGGAGWVLVPMLLPSYLCYAGYGLLRAPRTMLGDWIEQAAQHGASWLPVFAGRVIAAAGLMLWAWPLASVVLAVGLRNVPRDALEAVRLDGRGVAWRAWMRARLLGGWIVGAWGLVALVMMGSAVPLHLAQAPTYSVRVWFEMSVAPGSAGAWVSAWPLIVLAALSAGVIVRHLVREPGATPEGRLGLAARRGAWRGLAVMLMLSVGVPWAMMAWTVDSFASLGRFWQLSGEGLAVSGAVALAVGVVLAGLAGSVWMAAASFDPVARRVALACVGVMVFAVFVPGVLVGQATAQAWEWNPVLRDWPGLVVVGHVARFGGVAGVLGWALARSESSGARDARRLDGATGGMGFLAAVAPGRWPACVGVGLAGACLSLHEIETSVFLQVPGTPGLAPTLLGYLHYSRMGDLSAAGVWIVGLGLAGAWMVGVCVRRGARRHAGVQP